MPRYIFVTEGGRTVWDRYRVLAPGERVGDIEELDELSGVISRASADAFKEALKYHHRDGNLTVEEAVGVSWESVRARF
jgi:hypothetical protein